MKPGSLPRQPPSLMKPTVPPVARAADADLIGRALRLNELFSRWSQAQRDALQAAARLVRYRRRTHVMAEDRCQRDLLLVVAGCIEVSFSSEDGRKFLYGMVGPGQVVALVRLFQYDRVAFDYYAHEDSVLVHLPCDHVLSLLDADPLLWREVARLLTTRHHYAMVTLRAQSLGSTRRRVAAALLQMAEVPGQSELVGQTVQLRLSQNDLAAMLSMTRQTINKVVGEFMEAGLLTMAYKRFTLLDKAALTRLADED